MTDTEETLLTFLDENKKLGNAALGDQKYFDALKYYTLAIDRYTASTFGLTPALKRPVSILYSNRAQANLKLEYYGAALADADVAISADSTYSKAYYRRARAHVALGNLKAATADFRSVCQIETGSIIAKKNLEQCVKLLKQRAFEDAIHVDEDAYNERPSKQLIELMNTDGTKYAKPKDSDYDGPVISDPPTLEEIKALRQWFQDGKDLPLYYAGKILLMALRVLEKESTLVEVPLAPGQNITVVGDVHGQFYDLQTIFAQNGDPSAENRFLFNGDFVDRGSWGCETVLTLFAYKAALPEQFYLNRGNHEALDMNRMYGFMHEVQHKFGDVLMKTFTETFRYLPLAHVLANKIFVVHGGLPTEKSPLDLEDIRSINRLNIQDESIGHNLLWSDPSEMPGKTPSSRGAGFNFGPDYTEAFLAKNGLSMIIRSHEVKINGYEIQHGGKLATVFSAPNYCDQWKNKGAVVHFVAPDMKPEFATFQEAPHPNIPPMAYLPKSYTSMMGM